MPSAFGSNSTSDLLASRFPGFAAPKAPGPLAARLKTKAFLRSIAAEMKSPAKLASIDAAAAPKRRKRIGGNR
jgi:hypothetical protein